MKGSGESLKFQFNLNSTHKVCTTHSIQTKKKSLVAEHVPSIEYDAKSRKRTSRITKIRIVPIQKEMIQIHPLIVPFQHRPKGSPHHHD